MIDITAFFGNGQKRRDCNHGVLGQVGSAVIAITAFLGVATCAVIAITAFLGGAEAP